MVHLIACIFTSKEINTCNRTWKIYFTSLVHKYFDQCLKLYFPCGMINRLNWFLMCWYQNEYQSTNQGVWSNNGPLHCGPKTNITRNTAAECKQSSWKDTHIMCNHTLILHSFNNHISSFFHFKQSSRFSLIL